jgi:hypothetical protein
MAIIPLAGAPISLNTSPRIFFVRLGKFDLLPDKIGQEAGIQEALRSHRAPLLRLAINPKLE